MTLPYTIRPATFGDFDALSPLWRQLDEFHRKKDPVRFSKPKSANPRDLSYVTELIERPDRALLVAESCPLHEDEEARLMGLCSILLRSQPAGPVFPARVIFEIDNLVVDDHSRRRGVARELCREAQYWAKMRGANEMTLTVYDFNNEARRFYESMGFLATKVQMARPLL